MESKSVDVERKIGTISTTLAKIFKGLFFCLLVVSVFLLVNLGIVAYQLHNNGLTTMCAVITETNTIMTAVTEQTGIEKEDLIVYERNISDTDRTRMDAIIVKVVDELHFNDFTDLTTMKGKIKGVLTDEEYEFLQEQYASIQANR